MFFKKKPCLKNLSGSKKKSSHLHRLKVFIAAGGTGGHIYPALVIAELLKEQNPRLDIHFVGALGGMEEKMIGKKKTYPLHLLSVGRLNHNVSLREKLQTLLQLPWALFQSIGLLLRHPPLFVLGMGGHASGPFLLASSLLKKRTFIWEPNLYPGLTNRILSRCVQTCLVIFKDTQKYLKSKPVYQVGYPVRKSIEDLFYLKKEKKRKKTNPSTAELEKNESKREFRFLVLGGSQGSLALNQVICEMIQKNEEHLKNFHIIHQTGKRDFSRVAALYKEEKEKRERKNNVSQRLNLHFEARMYLHNIAFYYHWADLVLCRCGIGTLFELSASGSAALLVPLPGSSNQHQKKNAEKWAEKKAALLIPQEELSYQHLTEHLLLLREKEEKLNELSFHTQKLFDPEWRKEWLRYLSESI